MKRNGFILFLIILIGFSGCAPKPKAAIEIGDISFTAAEFEAAFAKSRFFEDGVEGKKKFLDEFLSKKIVLAEAEKIGLNQNPDFLQDIQMFWEQGLLKLMLIEKNKELVKNIKVTDQEIRDYFEKQKPRYYKNKDLADVYDQVKSVLLKEKQSQVMGEWIDGLRAKTTVRVNYPMLGISQ